MKAPLGKNEIGKLMKAAPQGAGLEGNITNHFVRKKKISRLMDAEVPVNYKAQISGHNAVSIEHQREMSHILSRSGEQSMQSSTTSSLVKQS